MYSTVVGARRFAKKLQRFLNSTGAGVSLSFCQRATARAGGFDNWHELNTAKMLGGDIMPSATEFRHRLVNAFPQRSRQALLDWLPWPELGDSEDARMQSSAVDSWLREVLPCALAILGQHRAHTNLFKRGSGDGLGLRLEILDALTIGGLFPDLDMATMELSLPLEAVQRRPRRIDPLQLERLAAEGVVTLRVDRLVLHPVNLQDLEARMAKWHASVTASRQLEMER